MPSEVSETRFRDNQPVADGAHQRQVGRGLQGLEVHDRPFLGRETDRRLEAAHN